MTLPANSGENLGIEDLIFILRGRKVMIDRDLSLLYGVETKYLNRQVRRNPKRFPEEFVFQLSRGEKSELVTNWHRFNILKHSSVLPLAFTENGVAMLAGVLNSDRAIRISVRIIQEFVRLRRMIHANKELSLRLSQLEQKITSHDESINSLLDSIHKLIEEPFEPKRRIGFKPD